MSVKSHRGYRILSVVDPTCLRVRVRVGKSTGIYVVASRPDRCEVYWSKIGGDIHRVSLDDDQCLRCVAPGELVPCVGGKKCKHKVLTAVLITAGKLNAGF